MLQTDMQSLLIKGLRLQRQRAQSPPQLCSPQTTKILQKERERVYTASCGSRRKLTKRRRKRIQGLWKERLRKVARLLGKKRRFRKGKSSKGDLYFGKGVASAWTLSVLSTTVRYSTVQSSTAQYSIMEDNS